MFESYSVIDMFGPIHGENWHPPEIHDGLTFRWSGPGATSTLRIPTMGSSQVRLRWVLAVVPAEHQIRGLRCIVDDAEVELRWAVRGAHASLWSDVELGAASRPFASAQLMVEPVSLAGSLGDGRRCGLAVNRVEIFSLSEAAIGASSARLEHTAAELRDQLRAREAELDQMRTSTSWKVSRPLRWLKRSLSGG